MGKRKLIISVLLLSLIGIGLLGRGTTRDSAVQSSATESHISSAVGLRVDRPVDLTEELLTDEEISNGQLWRFTQPADSQQTLKVTAYYEQGDSLKKLASVSQKPLRDAVLGNVLLQLPKQYPGYRVINRQNMTINGVEATEIVFTYESHNEDITQRLLLFFKKEDTVVYMRGQTKSLDYEMVNKDYFERLFMSAVFE